MALEIVPADRPAIVAPTSGLSPVVHHTQIAQEVLETRIWTQALVYRKPHVSGVVGGEIHVGAMHGCERRICIAE
jgi:hypothetical protein